MWHTPGHSTNNFLILGNSRHRGINLCEISRDLRDEKGGGGGEAGTSWAQTMLLRTQEVGLMTRTWCKEGPDPTSHGQHPFRTGMRNFRLGNCVNCCGIPGLSCLYASVSEIGCPGPGQGVLLPSCRRGLIKIT